MTRKIIDNSKEAIDEIKNIVEEINIITDYIDRLDHMDIDAKGIFDNFSSSKSIIEDIDNRLQEIKQYAHTYGKIENLRFSEKYLDQLMQIIGDLNLNKENSLGTIRKYVKYAKEYSEELIKSIY